MTHVLVDLLFGFYVCEIQLLNDEIETTVCFCHYENKSKIFIWNAKMLHFAE